MVIAFGTSTTGGGTATPITTGTITTVANSVIVVCAAINPTTSTITSITDPAANTYSVVTTLNSGNRVELWSTGVTTTALSAQAVTVNFSAAPTQAEIVVVTYTGVASLGINATNSGSTTTPTITATTQDSNNFMVAAMAASGTGTFTANVGNLRNSGVQGTMANSAEGCAGNDNTVVTPGSVTNTVTLSVSETWGAAVLELRTVAPTGSLREQATHVMGPPLF